jgi:hypothetical protein
MSVFIAFVSRRLVRWLEKSVFGTAVQSYSHIDFESEFDPGFRTRKPRLHEHLGGELDIITQPFGADYPTMHAVIQKAFVDYGNLPCMGTREYIKMHKGTHVAILGVQMSAVVLANFSFES